MSDRSKILNKDTSNRSGISGRNHTGIHDSPNQKVKGSDKQSFIEGSVQNFQFNMY